MAIFIPIVFVFISWTNYGRRTLCMLLEIDSHIIICKKLFFIYLSIIYVVGDLVYYSTYFSGLTAQESPCVCTTVPVQK